MVELGKTKFRVLKILGTIRGECLRDHIRASAVVAPFGSGDFQGTRGGGTVVIAASVGAAATALYG